MTLRNKIHPDTTLLSLFCENDVFRCCSSKWFTLGCLGKSAKELENHEIYISLWGTLYLSWDYLLHYLTQLQHKTHQVVIMFWYTLCFGCFPCIGAKRSHPLHWCLKNRSTAKMMAALTDITFQMSLISIYIVVLCVLQSFMLHLWGIFCLD